MEQNAAPIRFRDPLITAMRSIERRVQALVFIALSAFFSCKRGDSISAGDPPPPRFTGVSVHDPSVFPAGNGEFYVIGSHLAAAKTTDFMRWTQVTGDWNGRPNRFYPQDNPDPAVQTMRSQIDDVMRGAKNQNNGSAVIGFFAGDIHRMPDGRFFQYYCLTASWYCSAIGLAVADNAEGPYITEGLLVRSGEAAGGSKTPDGLDRWAKNRHPNCIDGQAFFDNDGNFWLVYGSWSGGIFLLELDPATGLPRPAPTAPALNAENGGYGRKLIPNNHASVEAPYIIYSPETQYYYLFVSYGGLAADGGYNIRLFRSRRPDGPYDDALHEDMGKNFQYGAHYQYGVKLMGGYRFKRVQGEAGAAHTGFLSPGHNSVYRDADTGRFFMIYHQRFTGRGEYHEVRVCELFLNEDGWLMAAPFRYDGGGVRETGAAGLAGTWKLINHGTDINTAPHESAAYRFKKDLFRSGGKIIGPGGEAAGAWELKDNVTGGNVTRGNNTVKVNNVVHLTLNGVLYKGVFLRCWDEDGNVWVQAFTALSEEGVALWGALAVSQ